MTVDLLAPTGPGRTVDPSTATDRPGLDDTTLAQVDTDAARRRAPIESQTEELDELLETYSRDVEEAPVAETPVVEAEVTPDAEEEITTTPGVDAAPAIDPADALDPGPTAAPSGITIDATNDGEFSWWEFGKNLVSGFVSPVVDCFSSWENAGKTLATVGAIALAGAALAVTFPVSIPLLGISGAALFSGALTTMAIGAVGYGGAMAVYKYTEARRTGNYDLAEQAGADVGLGLFSALPFLGRARGAIAASRLPAMASGIGTAVTKIPLLGPTLGIAGGGIVKTASFLSSNASKLAGSPLGQAAGRGLGRARGIIPGVVVPSGVEHSPGVVTTATFLAAEAERRFLGDGGEISDHEEAAPEDRAVTDVE